MPQSSAPLKFGFRHMREKGFFKQLSLHYNPRDCSERIVSTAQHNHADGEATTTGAHSRINMSNMSFKSDVPAPIVVRWFWFSAHVQARICQAVAAKRNDVAALYTFADPRGISSHDISLKLFQGSMAGSAVAIGRHFKDM